MSIFALSAVGTAFLTGVGKLRVRRALYSAGVGVAVLLSVVLVLNAAFGAVLAASPQGDATVLGLKMPPGAGGARVGDGFETAVYRDFADVPPATRIAGRRAERHPAGPGQGAGTPSGSGTSRTPMPFSYFNSDGELVGHDVQMAYDLAKVLNVSRVEFVPVDRANALDRVNAGGCDIVMAGLVLVPAMVEKARYTSPYIDLHLALVTRDDRKSDFEDLDTVTRMEGLRIAVAGDADYERAAGEIFPRATIVPLDGPEQFFNRTDADVLLTTAETRDLADPAPPLLRRRGPAAVRRPFGLVRLRPRPGLRRRLPDVRRVLARDGGEARGAEGEVRLLGAREEDGGAGAPVVGHPGRAPLGRVRGRPLRRLTSGTSVGAGRTASGCPTGSDDPRRFPVATGGDGAARRSGGAFARP